MATEQTNDKRGGTDDLGCDVMICDVPVTFGVTL